MSSYLRDVLKISDLRTEEEKLPAQSSDWLVASGSLETEQLIEDSEPTLEKAIEFSSEVMGQLRSKVSVHNKTVGGDSSKMASTKSLSAVYRRGANAFTAAGRPDISRHSWAMARVDAFLSLLASGRPSNMAYTADNDLLPVPHPKSQYRNSDRKSEAHGKVAAAITAAATTRILPEDGCTSPEQAIFAMAEYSGMGYDIVPSIRAAWVRAVDAHENPFERALDLACNLYSSIDADLLPKRAE